MLPSCSRADDRSICVPTLVNRESSGAQFSNRLDILLEVGEPNGSRIRLENGINVFEERAPDDPGWYLGFCTWDWVRAGTEVEGEECSETVRVGDGATYQVGCGHRVCLSAKGQGRLDVCVTC